MYKCKYFSIKELVSRYVYEQRGDKAWHLLDERALITLDALREKFGQIVVNNWSTGGSNHYRGLREPACKIGAAFSQHRFGRAFDCTFVNTTARAVREYILNNPEEFPYIKGIELDIHWLHFDVRNESEIVTFRP